MFRDDNTKLQEVTKLEFENKRLQAELTALKQKKNRTVSVFKKIGSMRPVESIAHWWRYLDKDHFAFIAVIWLMVLAAFAGTLCVIYGSIVSGRNFKKALVKSCSFVIQAHADLPLIDPVMFDFAPNRDTAISHAREKCPVGEKISEITK